MDVFYYIAENNTDNSIALCNKYNLGCSFTDDIAAGLEHIANTGEEGFKEVMNLHPEKDVMIQLFSLKPKPVMAQATGVQPVQKNSCGCGNSGGGNYMNAIGGNVFPQFQAMMMQQQNTLLMVGIIVLVGAAFYIKNK
jgi:hypothetical protein